MMMMQMEERPTDGKRRCRNMSQPAGTIIHIANSTETLSSIAAQYDTSISMLRKINKLMTDLIYPQQILYIPKEDFVFTNPSPSNQCPLSPSAPRPLSEDEIKQIDEECLHKFVKFKTKYIAKDKTIVDGVLLITPDGVMFDPTDMANSPKFQLVDSIMSVISISVYHDKDCPLNISKSIEEAEITYTKFDSETTDTFVIIDKDEEMEAEYIGKVIGADKEILQEIDIPKILVNIDNENIKINKSQSDGVKNTNISSIKDISINKISEINVSTKEISDLVGENIVDAEKEDPNGKSNKTKCDIDDSNQIKMVKNEICDNNIKKADMSVIDQENNTDKNKSSTIVDFSSSNTSSDAITIYLCLKVHKNFEAVHAHSFRGIQNKSHIRHEYWYMLPFDKNIDHLYAFFKRWSPSLTNAHDSKEFYFYEIESSNILFEQNNKDLIKDWEIVSLKEYQRLQNIQEVKKLPPPTLLQQSQILKPLHVQELSCNMPPLIEGMSWQLSYSTEEHGISLHTMYRKLVDEDVCLIIIEDSNECIFGAMVIGQIKITDHYSGSGESFLFTFQPYFKRYDWTGVNNFFVKGNKECLCLGASEGNNGLWLNEDLFHGRSQTCQTFDNEPLSQTEDFVIKCLEVWTFV